MKDEIENGSDVGEIDIVINNVVSTFFTRCHLNLKQICMKGMNVIYNQENKVVSMKLKKPSITASIWSSGKITCAGANSEEESLIASRKVARCLWRIGFETKFARFKIVNVLGTVHLPFDILLTEFSAAHPKSASYEPELHPGVTFKLDRPKASLKIFHTGSITIAASSAAKVKEAMELLYPLVYEYKLIRPPSPSYAYNTFPSLPSNLHNTPFDSTLDIQNTTSNPLISTTTPLPQLPPTTSNETTSVHQKALNPSIIIHRSQATDNSPKISQTPHLIQKTQNLVQTTQNIIQIQQNLIQTPQIIYKNLTSTPLNLGNLPRIVSNNTINNNIINNNIINNNIINNNTISINANNKTQAQSVVVGVKRSGDVLIHPTIKKYKTTPAGLVLLDD